MADPGTVTSQSTPTRVTEQPQAFTSVAAIGLPGASAASRYAGGTPSGSPSSGTFASGDYVISQGGTVWVCTAAGTPGTWAQAGVTIDSAASDIQPSPGTRAAGGVGKAADAGHVHGQPPDFAPTGLAGATAATRYAGATTSGAPASGTFAAGDFVIDQTGKVWICTDAGTPGTWAQAGAGAFLPLAGGTLTGALVPAVIALTDAATITVDASKGNVFTVTIAGDRTLANPSNPANGQQVTFLVTQGAGGSHALAFGTAYEFGAGIPSPSLSTDAGKADALTFMYSAAKSAWLLTAFANGFA